LARETSSFQSHALALLRIVAGFTFTLHGLQKIVGAFGGLGGAGHPVPTFTLLWFAGILEIVGGPLIILGLFTRPVAFILCGEMAVAYFRVHLPISFWPLLSGGEITVLYCFFFLYLVTAGPGAFSLDGVIRKR
jgi:putative oxidoreductase